MIGLLINNRYRIKHEIGHGGMGIVYRGYDTVLKRDVAIKMLTKSVLGPEGQSWLQREAQAVAQLSHDNIVTVYDVAEFEKSPFIVMEYVEGANLSEQPLKEIEEIVLVISQVCTALAHAHEHGIIHRDLKPENVILTKDGKVKLMDFGLACSISSRMTTEGTILGTVFYLAPEQAQGKTVDPRSDLYSLGVMLYELTTGDLPFIADDPLAVISQHIHTPAVPPRAKNNQIPPALEALILSLMSKDPKDRPASAKKVLEQLSTAEMLDKTTLPAEELSVLDRIVSGRIVGRERELKKSRQIWQQAMSGQSQLLLISGEPGVGKTRLVREIITQAEISGGSALIGSSYEEANPPYSSFRQILHAALTLLNETNLVLPEDILQDLLTITPELRPNFPDLLEYDPYDPEKQQQRLFDRFTYLVNLITNRIPVLLILEDAHWADASSLRLLKYLVRNTQSQPLMILVTYREVKVEEARELYETLLDFQRETVGIRLRLKRLNKHETEEMLEVLFAEEITPDFLEGIYNETDGNPFFIEEVCKAIVESGKLIYEEGRWKRPSMEEVGLPQSIQVAIQSRMKRLSVNTQKTLEQAAVIGREFDFYLLNYAMGIDRDCLLNTLDEALESRLLEEIVEEGNHRFMFVHSLVPTMIMKSLRTLHRHELHRRAALALETLNPEEYETLAYQFIEAGDIEKGVDYLIKAGDRARSFFAHEEAIKSYNQAVDHLIQAKELSRAARTLMKLGMAYHSDFQLTEACRIYDKAFNLYQQVGRLEKGEILPSAPHPYRILLAEPTSLDPNLDVTGWANLIFENLFSGLVELTSKWEIVPDVAQHWDVLDGARRYVFYLRKDFTWSDGVPVTAYDFEYAWKRAIDQASELVDMEVYFIIKNAEAYYKGDLKWEAVGVHIRDELTLEVELESPSISFLYLLSTFYLFPLPRHSIKKHGEDWMNLENLVTNGPYRLIEWKPSRSMHFEANPNYPGRFPGNAKHIDYYFINNIEREDAEKLYMDNKLDAIWLGHLPNPKRARLQYAEEFVTAPSLIVDYIGFNTKRPPFDDPRVRKALGLATDVENLVNTVFRGGGVFPATGGLLPPAMPGYTEGIILPFEPEEARRLLAEAGYPDGCGFPEIKAHITILGPEAQEIIEFQWKNILGIKVKWVNLPSEKFLEREWHKELDLWLWEDWPKYPAPELLLAGQGLKKTGWINRKYKELLHRAEGMMDYDKRLDLYRKAEKLLFEELPVLPISYRRFDYLLKPWCRNFPVSPSKGRYWKEIILEPH